MNAENSQVTDATIVVANADQLSTRLSAETVVLDLNAGAYYGVANVAARIWGLVQRPISVQELVEIITSEYDVELARCRSDAIDFLRLAISEGLVKSYNEPTD